MWFVTQLSGIRQLSFGGYCLAVCQNMQVCGIQQIVFYYLDDN